MKPWLAGLALGVVLVVGILAVVTPNHLGFVEPGHNPPTTTSTSSTSPGTTSSPATSSTSTGPPISGASQATCSGVSCGGELDTPITLSNVSNDNGTSSTRQYDLYQPSGLAASSTNRPPVVMIAGGSGGAGNQPGLVAHMTSIGRNASNPFDVVSLEIPPGRSPVNWHKKWINLDVCTAAPNCPPSLPSDQPYLRAVITDLINNRHADARRIYLGGASSGGNLAADAMCDPITSSMVRGFLIDSASMRLFGRSPGGPLNTPNCPSTDRNYTVLQVLSNGGLDAAAWNNTDPNPHFASPGVSYPSPIYFADWFAAHLGCAGVSPITGNLQSSLLSSGTTVPEAYTKIRNYRACGPWARTGNLIETFGVVNGGHTLGYQDSSNLSSGDLSSSSLARQCPSGATPNCLIPPGPSGPGATTGPGKVLTDGLDVEQEFINQVSAVKAP